MELGFRANMLALGWVGFAPIFCAKVVQTEPLCDKKDTDF